MSGSSLHEQAAQLLYAEGRALDERRWDDWLELLHPQVVYWVPAWTSDLQTTVDPDREVSLIFCQGRNSLAERVARVRSGRSAASSAPRRTLHFYSNVTALPAAGDELHSRAALQCCVHDVMNRRSHVFFAQLEHRFVREGPAAPWTIAWRRCVLLNDHVPGMLDFYCV